MGDADAVELAPLVRDHDHDADIEAAAYTPAPTPLPARKLAALCGVRLVDPIAFSQVFPYVNEMIDDLHLAADPRRIGFYSGLVESTFAISQLVSIYHWARLSGACHTRRWMAALG
jgi:hypothetical protein